MGLAGTSITLADAIEKVRLLSEGVRGSDIACVLLSERGRRILLPRTFPGMKAASRMVPTPPVAGERARGTKCPELEPGGVEGLLHRLAGRRTVGCTGVDD
jgi:hypothetical protein